MRIIKKKIGNHEYFYLQHSFRKNNKVITKEKYLGKEIPINIENIKNEYLSKSRIELELDLKKIKDNFQKEWNKFPDSIKEKNKEQIAISFTYNTNAIEGSTITLQETREIIEDKIAPRKPLRDIKETENHVKLFLEALKLKENITNDLILNWHERLFKETKEDIAGKYREYLVRVGDHIAPDWQDVKKLMNDLIKFVEDSRLNSVELAARVHYRFEKIHPFGDGNGRIGRLLMNYILWHNKYPMLIITFKHRRTYYNALKKDEDYFLKYFMKRYLAVHKKRTNVALT